MLKISGMEESSDMPRKKAIRFCVCTCVCCMCEKEVQNEIKTIVRYGASIVVNRE